MEVPFGDTSVAHVLEAIVNPLVGAIDISNAKDSSEVDDTRGQSPLASSFRHGDHEAIACSIWCLSDVSSHASQRREHDEEVQVRSREKLVQQNCAFDLGTDDGVERVEWHLCEQTIDQDHGAVTDTGDRRQRLL